MNLLMKQMVVIFNAIIHRSLGLGMVNKDL